MLTSYQNLQELTEKRKLKLYFILSLPRSRSQVFQIALSEADGIDGQINSPFVNTNNIPISWDLKENNDDVRDFDKGCENIIERYSLLKKKLGSCDRTINILVHEHVSNLMLDEIKYLTELSNDFIFLFRDPAKQVPSYFVRMLCDKLTIPFSDALSNKAIKDIVSLMKQETYEDEEAVLLTLLSYLETQHLKNTLNKPEGYSLSLADIKLVYDLAISEINYYTRVMWENFQCYLNFFMQQTPQLKANFILVDSEEFTKNTKQFFMRLLARIPGLSYSDSMTSNWSKCSGENFYCCVFREFSNNAWVAPSRQSKKINLPIPHAEFDFNYLPKLNIETIFDAASLYQYCLYGAINVHDSKLIGHDTLRDFMGIKFFKYWREKIDSQLQSPQLMTDFSIDVCDDPQYNSVNLEFDFSLFENIPSIVKSNQSIPTLFLALVNILLFKYTDQSLLPVGIPRLIKTNSIMQIDILPFISLVDNDETFEMFLNNIISDIDSFPTNEPFSYSQVKSRLKITKYSDSAKINKILFDINNIFSIDQLEGVYEHDLLISIDTAGSSISLLFNYNNSVFNKTTINRLVSHLRELLLSVISNPKCVIGKLSILTEAERFSLLVSQNQSHITYSDKTIHELFEEQVVKTPDNVVVIFEEQSLKYSELNQRANQLARYLRFVYQKNSGKPLLSDTLIPLSIDRSIEMLVGILGILKAGAAYVPIDTNLPQDRFDLLLEDIKSPLLLTHPSVMNRLILPSSVEALWLNYENYRDISCAPLDLTYNNNQLAYVIYTSGTSGKPKGVMIEHKSLINRLEWMNDTYPLNASDRILQKTPFVFDVSVWELLWAPLQGAAVVFSRPDGHKDSDYLCSLIEKQKITIIHFVPSMLRVFLNHLSLIDMKFLSSLTHIFSSGEALNWRESNQCYEILPDVQVHNLYGPTETSIDSLYYDCPKMADSMPIGSPIYNTQVHILDNGMQLVPIGVAGELYIGGAGLARGYLHRAELTEERFITHQFMERDEAGNLLLVEPQRLYRTGDLVRYLPDGNLEYIGRIDHQVKLRGYRIELGEIESVLRQHSDVKEVVVLLREDIPDQKLLVGYVTTVSGEGLDKDALREQLKRSLPDYMVPSIFVHLDVMPLTTNGKLDRKALPAPERRDLAQEGDYVGPSNYIEFKLEAILKKILSVDLINFNRSFFDLGGDSIKLIKFANIIKKEFQQDISIAEFYKFPAIIDITKRLHTDKHNFLCDIIIPFQIRGSSTPLFLVHPGGGLSSVYLHLSKYFTEQPIYGINNPYYSDTSKSFFSIQEMATYYINAIREIQPKGPYRIGGFSFGGIVAYEMAVQLTAMNETVEVIVLIDSINHSTLSEISKQEIDIAQTNFHEKKKKEMTDERIEYELMHRNMQDNCSIMLRYIPAQYDGRIVLIRAGRQDIYNFELPPNVNVEFRTLLDRPDAGWNEVIVSKEKLTIHNIDLAHTELLTDEFVPEVAENIKIGLSDVSPQGIDSLWNASSSTVFNGLTVDITTKSDEKAAVKVTLP